jgi:hypothetical protein
MADTTKVEVQSMDFSGINSILHGVENAQKVEEKKWNDLVAEQIQTLIKNYGIKAPSDGTGTTRSNNVASILEMWHKQITINYKHDKNFSPHVNGFYMIFMVHGTWYENFKESSVDSISNPLVKSGDSDPLTFQNPQSYFNMLATDIDIPDITEEYVSVSTRLRNSFVPSRNYFVSDFSISYIENKGLDIMRYHEAWHKYMNLLHRGEAGLPSASVNTSQTASQDCINQTEDYFVDIPYANAVWVAVFKPFTTDIQLLIKLIGVLPVTMPLKQVIGNRSSSKMTVLNISYKAADLFYKFYNGTQDMLDDDGLLAKSFMREVMEASN